MSDSNSNALLITPEATLASALEGVLPDSIAVDRVGSVDDALARLDQSPFEVLLVDLGSSADEALSQLLERAGETPVIAITDAQHAALGVQAVRAGAQDFLRNPFDPDEVLYVVGKSLKSAALHADEPPPSLLLTPETPILGTSRAMQELRATLAKAADGVATVLVRGESGSGKELVARQLHELSPRRQGPFVKVHSGALPDNLLESELFGYEKGAFTGATAYKPGRLDLAAGGTLFLDEIGDISPAVQVKLLRVLQDREYERLGGTRTLEADVRFVAATHRDLETLVREGKFREDLFYRLNVVSLWVPPLRERTDDIETLALHFCQVHAAGNGRSGVLLDVAALELLKAHKWPGNVRQLSNFIERLVVLANGPRIPAEDVQRELSRQEGTLGFAAASGFAPKVSADSGVVELAAALEKAERRALEKALKSAQGNRNVAARLLGISRRSLYYKLQEHGLS